MNNNKPIEPKLSDFDLSEKNIALYEKQLKLYDSVEKNIKQEHEKYNSRTPYIVLLITAVIFIIFGISLSFIFQEIDSNFVKILLAILVLAIYLFVAYTIYKKRDAKEFIYPPKENYIDIKLEQRVMEYKKAKKDFLEKKCHWERFELRQKKDFWLNMTGLTFEREVAALYCKLGYSVKLTKASGDGGVDIVIKKENKVIAVQCKHHSRPVGPNDIRALQGVVASKRYDYGIFVSLNGFTAFVHQELEYAHIYIELVDLNDLINLSSSLESSWNN